MSGALLGCLSNGGGDLYVYDEATGDVYYGNEYMTETTLWNDYLRYGSFGFYAGILLYHRQYQGIETNFGVINNSFSII